MLHSTFLAGVCNLNSATSKSLRPLPLRAARMPQTNSNQLKVVQNSIFKDSLQKLTIALINSRVAAPTDFKS